MLGKPNDEAVRIAQQMIDRDWSEEAIAAQELKEAQQEVENAASVGSGWRWLGWLMITIGALAGLYAMTMSIASDRYVNFSLIFAKGSVLALTYVALTTGIFSLAVASILQAISRK